MKTATGVVAIVLAATAAIAGAGQDDEETLAGGAGTVFDVTPNAFGLPARNIEERHRAAFFLGNSFFNKNWIEAPASVTDRDGLGPLFNARSCSACHLHDGRGHPPAPSETAVSLLVRVSLPGRGPGGAPRPNPIYGDQIQTAALPGLPAEAEVQVVEEVVSGTYGDGQPFQLLRPRTVLTHPGYGALARGLLTSARVAPAMPGVGLLEAVPDDEVLSRADPDDRDKDGISGRANHVSDRTSGRTALGRFGWKAEQPTVRQQVAAAFVGDMGITSTMMPAENHTTRQPACARRPSGGTPEVSDTIFNDVTTYARLLAVPARRAIDSARGQALFTSAGCARCHVPTLHTGDVADLPELGHQTIHPYTDLLLHDLGEGLDDRRPVFDAAGREWRTPPLWGLGLIETVNHHQRLLHDGRARGVAEAILWHGGEAQAARETFRAMTAADRTALVAFVQSL